MVPADKILENAVRRGINSGESKELVKHLNNFVAKRGHQARPGEPREEFLRRVGADWIAHGTPGAKMPWAKVKALAAQSGLESVGFSEL